MFTTFPILIISWKYVIVNKILQRREKTVDKHFLDVYNDVIEMAITKKATEREVKQYDEDEYFGVCTEDETDWLFKIER